MKIIYSWGHRPQVSSSIDKRIEEWNDLGYEVTSINNRKELDIKRPYSPSMLDKLYSKKDKILMKHYEKIKKLSSKHDVLLEEHGNVYHQNFLNTLNNIYKVFICNDDPDSSSFLSKPYVHAFDHSFTAGVYYDENIKIVEKYKEWGAKRADWRPIGFFKEKYDMNLNEELIEHQNRDIDLIFIGHPWRKVKRLATLKQAFPQMHVYGRGYGIFGLKAIIPDEGKILAIKSGLWSSRELPSGDFVPFYQRAKIGVNIHISYGPCNHRLYELPANGVMQVCDCYNGLSDVYDIGKEVIGYKTIEEAIELIKYYLEHEKERIKIAKAGFRRVMRDYTHLKIFQGMIKKIISGMKEDGYTHYKDGKKIE